MKQNLIQNGVNHLRHNGYFSVEALGSQFAQTMQCYLRYVEDFFTQEKEHKLLHLHSEETGYGYEYRGPEIPNEYKETFHLGLSYEPHTNASDADRRLIGTSKMLLHSLEPTIRLVASVISEASGKDLTDFLTNSLQSATLRVLYYPPDLPNMQRDFLATEHTDKGFTVHLGETSPGLQVHWNNEWVDVEEKPGTAYGYAGMLGQYYTECALTALRHRVIPTDTSRTKGRYAVVLFLDPGDYRYDKAKYGKTQVAFGKGENYGMPFSEFSKYFALKSIATAV